MEKNKDNRGKRSLKDEFFKLLIIGIGKITYK